MAQKKEPKGDPNRSKRVDSDETSTLGHLKDDLTWNTSVRAGKTESVRLPRDISGQNRTGCSKHV